MNYRLHEATYAPDAAGAEGRDHSAARLRFSDQQFRALIENALDLIAILDRDGVMLYVSPSVERVLGYRPENLIGRNLFALVHPDDLPATLAAFRENISHAGRRRWSEYRFRHHDGSWRFFESDACSQLERPEVRGVVVNSRDVTESRLAQERLVRSERQLAAAQALAHVGSWEWELADNRFVCSAEMARLLGLTPDQEISYDTFLEHLHPEDREQTRGTLLAVRRHHQPFNLTQRFISADGSLRYVISFGGIVLDNLGQTVRIFCACQDITETKQLEMQVQHAQKLETLGVLAGGIAHDFNNLLMVILGNAELAALSLPANSSSRESIGQIETAATRAADLCKQMLAYSGKGKFVVRPLDLSGLVKEMADLLEIAVAKKGTLSYELAEDLPAIEADTAQIQQVVMNLITNAADAVEPGKGEVHVQTRVVVADADFLAHCYCEPAVPEGMYVCLEVTDNGCGMDEQTQAHIFDPFFTTKFTGRGLGMAAVLGIIRGHRGAVHLQSVPGQGTTIQVLFPPSVQAARGFAKEAPALDSWRGQGTILVVDDEDMVLNVARLILESVGFEVRTARDGRQAVESYRQHPDKIDLVLMDMTMPHMNGEEAFARLREIDPSVRVVMASGYSEHEATSHITSKNLAGFIQKPYRAADLVAKLRGLLER